MIRTAPPWAQGLVIRERHHCRGKERKDRPHLRVSSRGCVRACAGGRAWSTWSTWCAVRVQSAASHPGPGSEEAHPAGQMIGIGLRAREPYLFLALGGGCVRVRRAIHNALSLHNKHGSPRDSRGFGFPLAAERTLYSELAIRELTVFPLIRR